MKRRMRPLAMLVLPLAISVAAADGAYSEDKLIGRDVLIGDLIPITGDPIRSVNLSIRFATNAANLTPSAKRQLDELAAALNSIRLRKLNVGVYGHTDARGAAEYNRDLSERRAQSVAEYLVRQGAVDQKRLKVRGYGETRLLLPDRPHSALNRRVEIVTSRPASATSGERREKSSTPPREPTDATPPDQSNGYRAIN